MAKSYRILRIARWVFMGFAYYLGVLVLGVLSGVVPLLVGGEPVPVLPIPDSPTIPARAAGAVNLFLSAPISFFILHGLGSLIHAVLEIRDHLTGRSGA
jgi:hypothetical protein